jgi:ribosomal protein S18 acetylase RimI-like enzyme
MTMVSVRHATQEDNEAVAKVEASAVATLRETYRPKAGGATKLDRIPSGMRRLVALLEGDIVGTTRYWVDGDALRIVGLGVHSQSRGKGVASALVGYLATIGRALGAKRLVLHTVKQTGNVPIFQRLGFQVVAETDDQYSDSDKHATLVDVEMQKPLDAPRAYGAQRNR